MYEFCIKLYTALWRERMGNSYGDKRVGFLLFTLYAYIQITLSIITQLVYTSTSQSME